MFQKRIKRILEKLQGLELDGLLVTYLPNVRYLTGFTGSSGMCFISEERKVFLTDSRYDSQSHEEVKGMKILIAADGLIDELERRKVFRGMRRVGIEGNHLAYTEYQKLKKTFPRVKFLPQADLVESLSSIKEDEEIALIREAAKISDKVFQKILGYLRPGVRELEVSAAISYYHKIYGAERDSFEPIVASGARGALPHAVASAKKIRRGEFVTLDFGCVYRGYCCDITRTVAVGQPSRKLREVYEIVHDAQARALEAAKTGVTAKALDAVARDFIAKRGLGQYFSHSLGHGIGLQVHEPPRISSRSSYELQTGNVITIEPGIYLPGLGGVRIEDDIVVLNGRCRVLNRASKELLVL